MELLNQPFSGQLGNRLIELLNTQEFHTLNIAVAFAKTSGVLRLKRALEHFRQRGGKVNVYVGVDLGGTSYEALTALLLLADSLNVVHAENGQTFHPKIYQFLGKHKGLVIVGSHNLTGGGLWTNFESSVITSVQMSGSGSSQLSQELTDYFFKLCSLQKSCMPIHAQSDIDQLLEHGYILKEIDEQLRRSKTNALRGTQISLFGNGTPATLPSFAAPKKKKTAQLFEDSASALAFSPGGEGQTIWFETRRLTGGSRNILDLSKRSLVERGDPKGTSFDIGEAGLMRGAVAFFGLDPADIKKTINVTINFDGIDFANNEILYPSGHNANGTWRLQIKGISASGQKITDALKTKGTDYLVNKIVTFTKIAESDYAMSVFLPSDLKTFEEASFILARNGSTRNARRLGLLEPI